MVYGVLSWQRFSEPLPTSKHHNKTPYFCISQQKKHKMDTHSPPTTEKTPANTTNTQNTNKVNSEFNSTSSTIKETVPGSQKVTENQISCSSAEVHLVENENSKKVLLAMVVGLKDEENNVFDGNYCTNEYPTKHRRKWMPSLADFVAEIKRRKVLMGQKPKANSQMKLDTALNWLNQNPITDEQDKDYVLTQMKTFMNASSNLAGTDDSSPKSKHWKGSLPFLRLIHCLVDNDEVREAFQRSFTVLSRKELDGRKNPETQKACPWELISKYFNSASFNPKSTKYPQLHDEFKEQIDLSFDNVKGMGELNATKAKSKFVLMKNYLIFVKMNYEKSGNGDGCMALNSDSSTEDILKQLKVIDGDDKKNFLQGRPPYTLYFWMKVDECNLMESVTQQLNDVVGIDTSSNLDVTVDVRKRNSNGDLKLEQLSKSIDTANEIARANVAISEKKIKQDDIHKYMDLIENLESKILTFEEKLFTQEDKNSSLSVFYSKRLVDFKKQIETYKEKLKQLQG